MDPYSTHLPVLVTALNYTMGVYPTLPILECGCGDYSTPIIKALRGGRKHKIMSADKDWYNRYADDVHSIEHVNLQGAHHWEDVEFTGEYGLCLMDSEEYVMHRVTHIPKLLEVCKVVVMHDAHFIPEAKFSYMYRRYDPPTWIGSNHVDVREWF